MSPATYPPPRSPSPIEDIDNADDEATIPLYHGGQPKYQPPPRHQRPSVVRRFGLPLAALLIIFAAAAFFWRGSPLSPPPPPPPRPDQPGSELPDNAGQQLPHPSGPSSDSFLWQARANAVRDAYVHAYDAYLKYAFPKDELYPLTNGSQNNFNGWGVTTVDSIDTFLLMGLKDKYYDQALTHVKSVDFGNPEHDIGFFETTIRYLGGLLSAFAMTGEETFRTKADELGGLLLHVFETKSGLPTPGIIASNKSPKVGWDKSIGLAEMSTFQMEFKYLAHVTGKKVYYEKAEHVNKVMQEKQADNGLWPDQFSVEDGSARGYHYSVGGASDSAYEYLLKQYLLTNKTEPRLLDMYLKSAAGVISHMMYLSPDRHLLWHTDLHSITATGQFQHLACFYPGLLALGAVTLPPTSLPKDQQEKHMWAAQGLTETCYLTYADHKSGLGVEAVTFPTGKSAKWEEEYEKWLKSGLMDKGVYPPGVAGGDVHPTPDNRDYSDSQNWYILRPEVLESMYLMYKTTGSQVWRERAWGIFQAIEKWTKVEGGGYASVNAVDSDNPYKRNDMPSYFLAETLKYLYLIFHPDPDVIRLDEWVFNTEAHPLPVFQWSAEEVANFGVGQ